MAVDSGGNEKIPQSVTDFIPFARPFIGKEEEDAVLRVLRSGWLTTAAEALAFEDEFAARLNLTAEIPVKAAALNSATSGLHLALEACGVRAGDVVIVPSYTFAATAEAAVYLGADVAFVDCAPNSFLLDPAHFEKIARRLIEGKTAYESGGPTGRPRAVIPVHFGGLCVDMDAVNGIARRFGISVIEDAAHAFPAYTEAGFPAGTLGDAGVFSFYATKTLTTAEGGMLVSRNADIIKRVTLMRCHGIDRNVWNRYTSGKASWYYEVIEAGCKYNLPDILAAIGRVQLGRADDLLDKRKSIAACYDAAFSGDSRFSVPPSAAGDARHLYPLRLNPTLTGRVSRDDCISRLKEMGIGVSVHFIPLHTMPYYKKRYDLKAEDFPQAEDAYKRVISLPVWPGMTRGQVDRVIDSVLRLI
ncbi:MAG: DegT/DnrJ/EryC1/StrS family aminotransferase [Spirochaetaceae bacterium]|jgi:dTDP-4-amino-4,6-dideoxygalactose transaminase|nr:DegT/DnrJ/EryC1/StrS family aminotransferase [Spirochaetaceae bacterium]